MLAMMLVLVVELRMVLGWVLTAVGLVMWLVLRMGVPARLQMVVHALMMILVPMSVRVVLVLVRMKLLAGLVLMKLLAGLVLVVRMALALALVRSLRVMSLTTGLMVMLVVALVRMRWWVPVVVHVVALVMSGVTAPGLILTSLRPLPCPPQRPLRPPHC